MKRFLILLLLAAGCSKPQPVPVAAQPTEAQSLARAAAMDEHVTVFNREVRGLPGFSDLWIEHEPSWRVIVAFTAPPRRERVLALAPGEIRDRIEIRRAKRTQAEIGADIDAIAAALNGGGFDYTASYSPKSERFEVTVGTPAIVERARQLLPERVKGDTHVVVGPLPVSLTPQDLETPRPTQPRR